MSPSNLRTVRRMTGLLLLAAGATAFAQVYPSRPIRFVVPYPPSGGTDVIARTIAQKMVESWGQQVVVDNRGGASTILGADIVAKSPPDGYTLLLSTATTLTINPTLHRKLPYHATRDLAPVTQVVQYPYIIAAYPGVPANTIAELVALAKAKPGHVTYGSSGPGSSGHLGGALFEQMTGTKMVHVPYKGTAPAVVDLVAGQINLLVTGVPSIYALLKANRVKIIAAGSDRRLAEFPQVQTMAEAGYPGYWARTWFAVSTRAGSPAAIIDKLNREIIRILQLPDVKERLEAQGFELVWNTPAEFARLIDEETVRWAKLARDVNIRID